MTTSLRIKIAAYLVGGSYALALAIAGLQLPGLLTKLLSFLPVVIVALFAVLDRWLWHRTPILPLMKTPYIHGTWHGTLKSYRRDDQDMPIESDHEVFLVIRQDLTGLTLTMLTPESKSMSSAASIVRNQADDFAVLYQYENKPRMSFRSQSPIHSGGAAIEVSGRRPVSLAGEYWTARDSRGTFALTLLDRSTVGSFDEGMKQIPTSTQGAP